MSERFNLSKSWVIQMKSSYKWIDLQGRSVPNSVWIDKGVYFTRLRIQKKVSFFLVPIFKLPGQDLILILNNL